MPPSTTRSTGLGPWINSIGVLVVAYWLLTGRTTLRGLDPVVAIIGFTALAAWGVRVFLPASRGRDVLTVVMLVGGALTAGPTQGLMITPAVISVSGAGADRMRPVAFSGVLAAVGLAIVAGWVLLTGYSGAFLLGCAAGFGLGVVVGYSRRQASMAQQREIELVERSAEIEREHERSALLADRATIARDIHDVLAHSLGGLVIQLDAVEALLENGRTDEAAVRVAAARALAADGLGEARRAVAALRDPGHGPAEGGADSLAAPDAIDGLLAAHEALGGRIVVAGRGPGGPDDFSGLDPLDSLDDAHRRALAAITREALSNVRRHAPGETVTVRFDRPTPGILRTRIANALPSPTSGGGGGGGEGVGGGNGLLGMRERVAALHDLSSLTTGVEGGEFVVEVALEATRRSAAGDGPVDRGSLGA